MRVAMWTPLPPEPSGISDYSFELLGALATRLDVVAVVRDDVVESANSPAGISVVGAGAQGRQGPASADVDVYHMGNDLNFHRWIHDRAVARPGVVVLHDASLFDFYAGMCPGATFADEALWSEGVTIGSADYPLSGGLRGIPTIRAAGLQEPDRLALLFSRRLAESSLAVIVHNEWLAGELRRRHPAAPVHVVYHGASVHDDRSTAAGARSDLGWDPSHFVFGVFGGISRLKRVPAVVAAFAALHQVHPFVRLVIAGRADDSSVLASVARAVTAAGLERVVRVLVDPPGDRFEGAIDASDVVVNLRWPTAGETSGVMMRAFGAGKPVITSALPQHEALPASFCWQIPVEETSEGRGLYEMMSAAVRDREQCGKAGRAARAFVDRSATWRIAGDRYAEILDETVAERAGAPHKFV